MEPICIEIMCVCMCRPAVSYECRMDGSRSAQVKLSVARYGQGFSHSPTAKPARSTSHGQSPMQPGRIRTAGIINTPYSDKPVPNGRCIYKSFHHHAL